MPTDYNIFPRQIKYLLLFYATYPLLLVLSHLMVLKPIVLGPFATSAAIFILPLSYTICDIVAEVYGYKTAKNLVFVGTLLQLLVGTIIYILLKLPSPQFWKFAQDYKDLLAPQILISLYFAFANYLSAYLNAYLLTKWKFLLKGRFFAIRSIGSSLIGESLFTLLTAITYFHGLYHIEYIVRVIISVVLIKLVYAVLVALPATFLVIFLNTPAPTESKE